MPETADSFVPTFFKIELENIECGKFKRCEGLEVESYLYEIEEGGLNTHTHKFVGRTRFPNIVLENGVTESNDLFQWYMDNINPDKEVERKDGSIVLCAPSGEELKRWNFFRALPCKWIGPQLSSELNDPAIERIEIAHERLEVDAS
ncbi:MAG: phage tail protein [bacterium]|nr:phage tail protein [bacterium]